MVQADHVSLDKSRVGFQKGDGIRRNLGQVGQEHVGKIIAHHFDHRPGKGRGETERAERFGRLLLGGSLEGHSLGRGCGRSNRGDQAPHLQAAGQSAVGVGNEGRGGRTDGGKGHHGHFLGGECGGRGGRGGRFGRGAQGRQVLGG